MPSKYETRVIKVIVAPKEEPIFGEAVTSIEIEDESGGEFVKIQQVVDHAEPGVIYVEYEQQWDEIKAAVDKMLRECRP